jgi:hypothetical protein
MRTLSHAHGTRYSCRTCFLSIQAKPTDELVQRDVLAMLDPKAWRRLRQGQTSTVDSSGFEDAMNELSARFVAGDIDAAELSELAEALRRQQETVSAPPPPLPDVVDVKKAWSKLNLEQRRLVIMAATESLTIKAGTIGARSYDESRVLWTPVR